MRHHEGATPIMQKYYYITTRHPPVLEEPVGPNNRLSLVRV